MLVLRRKPGEALVINGIVTVCVLGVEDGRVKLGIIAPDSVAVVRGELLDAERQQQQRRRKEEALARETDPRQREKLARSLERLEQSIAQMQPAQEPATVETTQQEASQ